MVIVFCLHNSNRMISIIVEKVVRLFGLLAIGHIALDVDLAVRDLGLHRNIEAIPPPAGVEGRCDEIELDILFGHLLFIKNHSAHHLSLFSSSHTIQHL